MTYVTRDGQVLSQQPWGVRKVIGLFWCFIDLIIAFFSTMVAPLTAKDDKANNFGQGGNFRRGGGGGGGGSGGGGGGGGPRGPPKPPRRNFYGMNDIRGPPGPPPSCASGGCCG